MFNSDVILPFENASHRFLQVLVHRFFITRLKNGFRLEVEFNEKSPTIWSNQGKNEISKTMPDFKINAEKYQNQLDDFLLHGKGGDSFLFDDPDFLFRFASGGTLPIIRRGGKEYYCFFYREIEPVGWNIANGGCDSKSELLNPIKTIERELREELIVFNCDRKEWLLFEAGEGAVSDSFEFSEIRDRIKRKYPAIPFERFKITEIPLKWLDGPDELSVKFGDRDPVKISGCFLNINALDFGIEIDRIAWISMDPESICMDGETWEDTIVDSPVGLFEVEQFNALFKAQNYNEFFPDNFFYEAMPHDYGNETFNNTVVKNFVPRMASGHPWIQQSFDAAPIKYGLCPVTRRIVHRYISTLTKTKKDDYDIFISFASEDRQLARKCFDFLLKRLNMRIFFDEESMHDGNWSRQIDRALESARILIIIGSRIDYILKPYVEYEWRAFHQLSLDNQYPENRKCLIPLMFNIDPRELPLALRSSHGFFSQSAAGEIEPTIAELLKCIQQR